jgi:hypothetical protein
MWSRPVTSRIDRVIMLIEAVVTVTTCTILAKLLSYRQIAKLVSTSAHMTAPVFSANSVRGVVERASRAIPGATCVPQALAAHRMLARRGYTSKIVIGVERNQLNKVAAHAWVVSGDQIIIGGTQRSLERFRILMTLGPNTI